MKHLSTERDPAIGCGQVSAIGLNCMRGFVVSENQMRLCILLLIAVALSACVSTPASRLPEAAGAMAAPDFVSAGTSGAIRIEPLDQLDIKVFNVPDIDGTYQVGPDGEIKMPLVGLVEAGGLTVFELADRLEVMFEEKYLQNPLVSVSISDANGARFTAEGAVRNPGMHPVRGDLTLIQAIALSGGATRDANPNAVIIFRTIGGERKAARFDLNKIRAGEFEDPKIYANDIVIVDGREQSMTYNEVLRSLPLVGLFFAVVP